MGVSLVESRAAPTRWGFHGKLGDYREDRSVTDTSARFTHPLDM